MPFRTLIVSIVLLLLAAQTGIAEQGLKVRDGKDERLLLPLGFSSREILGLDRSGELLTLDPRKVKDPQVIPRFRAYSQSEMRGDLLREFGKHFEVTGTGNYLVVHPKGARNLWANRFEELYRSMVHFFRQRGYNVSKPKFPLVGIVFHSRAQYQRYCSRVLKTNVSSSYGVYMPKTNRIYLYDATQGAGKKSLEWEENLATVMHEAAHQTAFNVGIHMRAGGSPVWLIEGLGCLFEAEGIYDAFHHRSQADRLNEGRLRDFKSIKNSGNLESFLMGIVASDKKFRQDMGRSYAAAWALTFYLSEKQPRDFIRFIKKTSKVGPYDTYSASDRVRDFRLIFGKDTKMLTTRVSRFVDEL